MAQNEEMSREELLAENLALRAQVESLRALLAGQQPGEPASAGLPPRQLTDALPVLVGYVDADLRYQFANAAYHEWFDMDGPIVGCTVREVIGDEVYAMVRQRIERALRGEEVELDIRFMGKGGKMRTGLVRYIPHLGLKGEVLGFHVVATDISRIRAREQALRESEERFRQLADAMPQIVWTARPDGSIDYYNRRWRELMGAAADAGCQSQRWKQMLHPDDVLRSAEAWSASLRDGSPFQVEHRLWDRHRGRYRWYLERALPVRDEQGCIARWYGTCTDIDDQKRAEEHLARVDRRKDDFLAMLGHELRNPLSPVLNGVQILKTSQLAPLLQRTVDIMERQLRHMVRLLDDLLDLSRISRGKIQLHKERVELSSLVASAIEDGRPLVERQGQVLEVSLAVEPLMVEADPARLVQVVANLLDNAAKYSPAGSRISIATRRDEDMVVISVADQGVGIDAAELPYIFDLFVQTQRSLDRGQGGLGIGLTLVRRLVRKHGGTVYARSEGMGKGSEIVVRLPLAGGGCSALAAPAGEPCRQADALPLGADEPQASRILVVDDNEDAAMLLTSAMEAEGYPVHTSHEGPAALAAFQRFVPDIVLLDIGLPGMDGYEVARRIRATARGDDVLLIAVTGYGQHKDVEQARAAGFDHHLLKPVDMDSLRTLLDHSRGSARARR